MSDQFLGEIRLVGFNFAPQGWLSCNGQLVSIAEYDTLFTLIGTTYGGDGQSTFALPDLRGRHAVGVMPAPQIPSYVLGEMGGTETVTLNTNTMPGHSHQAQGSTASDSSTPGPTTVWGLSSTEIYGTTIPTQAMTGATTQPMASDALGPSGGSAPHQNLPPFLAVNAVIAVTGIYPPQS